MFDSVSVQPGRVLRASSHKIALFIEKTRIVSLLNIFIAQRYAQVVSFAVQDVALATVHREVTQYLIQVGLLPRKFLDLCKAQQMDATLIPGAWRSHHHGAACSTQTPSRQLGTYATKMTAGSGVAPPLGSQAARAAQRQFSYDAIEGARMALPCAPRRTRNSLVHGRKSGSTLPRSPWPRCGSHEPTTPTAVSSFWLTSHAPPARGPGQLASGPLGVVGGCNKISAGLGGALPLALRVGVRRTGRVCKTS